MVGRQRSVVVAATAAVAVLVVVASVLGCGVHAQQLMHPCTEPACTDDPASTCDEAYQGALSSIETTQASIEQPAQHLLSLSGGTTDASAFQSQASQVSAEASTLQSQTSTTLGALDADALAASTQAAVSTHTDVSVAAASLEAAASELSTTVSSTSSQLTGLNTLFSSTSADVSANTAGLCPTNLPPADNYHFSGDIDAAAGGYGSFQMETGALQNDMLITFQVQEGDTLGIMLATSSSVAPTTPPQDGFVLAATDDQVLFRLTCDGTTTEVATAFQANASVLHTIHVVRDEAGILLRIDGTATSTAVPSCRLNVPGIVHVGTPSPIVIRGQPLPSASACIRTISIDGVLIVQKGRASTSSTSDAECSRTISDVFVLLDTSTSLPTNSPSTLRSFLAKSISPLLSSTALNARVALAQFAGPGSFSLISPFTADNATLFANFDANYQQQAGLSYIGTALRRTAEEFSMNSQGSNRLLLVLTDGRTTADDVVNVPVGIEALQQLGVVTIALGIGSSINMPTLLDIAGGIEANVQIVGDEAGLVNVNRDFIEDICVTTIPRLALFEQVAINNCTQLGCADYVAHSALLPDVQTFVVAENERVKAALLDEARAASDRISSIGDWLTAAVSRAQSASARIDAYSAYIASMDYSDAVDAVSSQISRHSAETDALSTLASALEATATQEASAAETAADMMDTTLSRLREALTGLTGIDIDASLLLTQVLAKQSEATAAVNSANSQLSLASSLQQTVVSLDGQLSVMNEELASQLVTQHSSLEAAVSAALEYSLPVSVGEFRRRVSQLRECLTTKVDLRQELSLEANELVAEHSQQVRVANSLEAAVSADTSLYSQLSSELDSVQSGLSSEADAAASIEGRLAEETSGVQVMSTTTSELTSRQAAVTARHADAAELTSQLELDIASTQSVASSASDVTDAAVECYDAASTIISNTQATGSNLRQALNAVNSEAASASIELAGTLSSQLDALASNTAEQLALASQHEFQATSLMTREQQARGAADALSTLADTIAPECFEDL